MGEDVEKRGPSCTVVGNVNQCGHFGKQYGGFSQKLKIELQYNPEVPLWLFIQRKQKH